MNWTVAGRTAAIAAALALASPDTGSAQTPIPPGTPSDIIATGGDVWASYAGQAAILYSELWFFGAAMPSPSQPPTGGLFVSHNSGIVGNPTPLPAFSDMLLGNFAAGTPLVFGLFVPSHNRWFYSGPGGNNPDNNIHVRLAVLGGGALHVGFEDLCRGVHDLTGVCSASNPSYIANWDYNDHMFELTNATVSPEPISMILMGTGMLGLGMVRRRRRRDNEVV
jgi:hypothetical protein